jgi:pimeloyl-ACP methyl ester carboxylesterase
METLNINGYALAFNRSTSGSTNNIPLLLIHGFPLDSACWNEVIPFLVHDFDVITVDLRGFGKSSRITTPYSISDMADDLVRLIDHLNIEKISIAGHSMGGYVALEFAKKYPEKIYGMGLISSQAKNDTPEKQVARQKQGNEIATNGIQKLVDSMPVLLSTDHRVQGIIRLIINSQNPFTLSNALNAMAAREDYSDFISQIKYPLVLIHGDADQVIPMERSREIADIVPSSIILILHGAGHMPPLEFAQKTAEGLKSLAYYKY